MADKNDASFMLVAAIDFGTTYSGYGFSFKDAPDDIKMAKNWGAEVGHQSYKTPTSLLVDKTGKFKAFGYEAEQEYGNAVSPDENEENDDNEVVEGGQEDDEPVCDMHLFKHFKMDLHGKEKLDKSVKVTATDGFKLPAVDVFGMALKFLKDHLIEAVSNALQTSLEAKHVRWVLTVPAIWSEVAKNFMKEAAVKGELVTKVSSDNLIIALEPEAASLFCRTKDVSHFVDDGKVQKEKLKKDDKYMVVDAGGGTMDITVHEVQADDKVKELHRASGGPWGGIYVDKQLAALYDQVLGKDVMDAFKEIHPNHWMNMMIDWEVKKKGANPDDKKAVNLTINAVLSDFYSAQNNKKSIKDAIKEKSSLGVRFANGLIRISADKTAEMFDNVIKPTMDHLTELLKKPKVKDTKCIFIVGGFGESKFLQHRIKTEFGTNRAVLIPMDAGLCVIKGAVLFGHSPNAITSRIARRTFCFRTTKPKAKGVKYNDSQLNEDGTRIRYLRPLVTKNEEVSEGDIKTITTRAVNATQTSVKFKIFTSDSEEVNDPDAKDVYELGELVIDVEPAKKGQKAGDEIELQMEFGGTSVKVTAKHKATGRTEVADFNRPDA